MAKKSGKDSAISRREAIPLAATSGTKSLTSCRSRFRSGSALANESDHDPPTHTEQHPGISAALNYPLFKAIFNRRSRRVMKGTKNVHAGAMSYTSNQSVVPLDSYEEAMLIALCCKTGFSMPDRPFQNEKGEAILGTPYVRLGGRTAGSADNAHNTHMFMMNDSGVYYIDHLNAPNEPTDFTPENLLSFANKRKKKVKDGRLNFPRVFPYYFDSNRFNSNLEGSTIFFPVVDMSIQYINGLMYLLTQEPGFRPVFVDDKNGFIPAGVGKWIGNGFLNKEIVLPLSLLGTFRAQIEADLLMQNLMLALQAMGLGGWIHASQEGPIMMGHPNYKKVGIEGLDFDYSIPANAPTGVDPKLLANPTGFRDIIKCLCPPNYKTMDDAVDKLLEIKYGAGGTYTSYEISKRILKEPYGEKFIQEVPRYTKEVVDCAKDICRYIFDTHGRFPAHVDAIHMPGIWIQAQHLDLEYYDKFFQGAVSETHRQHDSLWHSNR